MGCRREVGDMWLVSAGFEAWLLGIMSYPIHLAEKGLLLFMVESYHFLCMAGWRNPARK